MPHQCTTCGHVFADGSKEMLGGCPECGGAKFQFHPKGADIPEEPTGDSPPEREGGSVAETVGRATTTVRDWVGDGSDPDAGSDRPVRGDRDGDSQGDADPRPWPDDPSVSSGTDEQSSEDDIIVADDEPPAGEDRAQASARSEVASPDELPDPSERDVPPGEGRVVREPTGERPDMSQLREELNDQFESIKILEPGQYELNLMELYDREEYIIALRENGRYVIQMPENWIGRDADAR
ncbi:Zn-ribbon domain-containing protein [Halomarina litorea]|uniref:Zn-ribbon domain-containing protein n=1 Tax=Halomarina litorea TaxID=2961595 RepID=UPI0020C2334D|nr:Zn-ribbon domain-containing protein [Halomarina sp. BCD28]